jgi:hypothetical protein
MIHKSHWICAVLCSYFVSSKKLSPLGTCPYPQFELLQNSHTPVANECASKLKIEVGLCKGATVYIKALGMYTTVVDLQFAEGGDYSHCVGEDLVTTALLNRTVKVPTKYFGSDHDGCLEFPTVLDPTPRDSTARFMKGDHGEKTCHHGNPLTSVHLFFTASLKFTYI